MEKHNGKNHWKYYLVSRLCHYCSPIDNFSKKFGDGFVQVLWFTISSVGVEHCQHWAWLHFLHYQQSRVLYKGCEGELSELKNKIELLCHYHQAIERIYENLKHLMTRLLIHQVYFRDELKIRYRYWYSKSIQITSYSSKFHDLKPNWG